MVATLKQEEAIPASYPAAPSGLSTKAAALDAVFIWQRVEAYVARRWTERAVVWIVEGAGEWTPPLAPATVNATDIWNGATWESVTLSPSALGGYTLPGCGPYRFTASVGAGTVPAAVNEAFRRLAEYFAAVATNTAPGLREDNTEGLGSSTYDAGAVAKAMERSGAGDLLRPYRRAA